MDAGYAHAQARLLCQAVGQPCGGPHRERQVQGTWPPPHQLDQPLAISGSGFGRLARARRVGEAVVALGLVAMDPTSDCLTALAHDRGDLGEGEALLGQQQDHLRTRADPNVTCRPIEIVKPAQLIDVQLVQMQGTHRAPLWQHPQHTTKLMRVYLGLCPEPTRDTTSPSVHSCRRLASDHEATLSAALAFFVLAAAMLLVRRSAKAL